MISKIPKKNKIIGFFHGIDKFKHKLQFSFQGSRYYGTVGGGLLSIGIYGLGLFYLISLLMQMFAMTVWDVTSTEDLTSDQQFDAFTILNGTNVTLYIPMTS